MPVLPFYRNQIIITVADKVFDNTIIKQEVIFVTLKHNQDIKTGISIVEIFLLVSAYSDNNGLKGVPLNNKGIPDKLVQLVADNNTLVDFNTGALLLIRSDEDDKLWSEKIDSFTQDTMLQGDYFNYLRDNHPVKIGDLIIANIIHADTIMNKFS